jgi:hypothetical protein
MKLKVDLPNSFYENRFTARYIEHVNKNYFNIHKNKLLIFIR